MSVRLLAALPIALAAACGGSSSPPDHTGGPAPTTVTVTDADDGSTVHVRTGGYVIAELSSTYWQFDPPAGSVLTAAQTPPPSLPPPSCSALPGSGCGWATSTYRVSRAGTATLTAHRDSCGEALRCTGSQGVWKVTIDAVG